LNNKLANKAAIALIN